MEDKKVYSLSEFKDIIKNKDIVDVLLKLEVIDEDDLVGRKMLCAFHEEKTPSMAFYEDSYHCFGCGAHGDAFTFVEDVYDFSFFQACELIAEAYGVKLAKKGASGNPFLREDRIRNNISRKAIEDEWQKYIDNIKLVKDKEKLEYIKSLFPLEVGFDAKINYYVFRYTSKNNKTLGFTKRRAFEIDPNEKGKYPKWMHSSIENSFISECGNMYNLGAAIKSIRDKKSVILVEGPKDTIPWLLSNKKEVVAISGTHNIDSVFEILPKLSHVTLSLDGDEAGRKGARDIVYYLSDKLSLDEVKYIPLDGLDPYDFYEANHSMNEEDCVLDLLKDDELKELYNLSSLFNKDIIVTYLSKKRHITYTEAESFFDMKLSKKQNERKKKESLEIDRLVKSNDPDAMKKLAIKYGLE